MVPFLYPRVLDGDHGDDLNTAALLSFRTSEDSEEGKRREEAIRRGKRLDGERTLTGSGRSSWEGKTTTESTARRRSSVLTVEVQKRGVVSEACLARLGGRRGRRGRGLPARALSVGGGAPWRAADGDVLR